MYKLSEEKFAEVEKFVVVKGENRNGNRCLVIPINIKENVTCCMDEIDEEIRVCQVNGKDTDILTETFWAIELIKMSENRVYNVVDEEKYRDYVEVIKMETECCDKDCANCKSILDK